MRSRAVMDIFNSYYRKIPKRSMHMLDSKWFLLFACNASLAYRTELSGESHFYMIMIK